jgi:hypothetical protein
MSSISKGYSLLVEASCTVFELERIQPDIAAAAKEAHSLLASAAYEHRVTGIDEHTRKIIWVFKEIHNNQWSEPRLLALFSYVLLPSFSLTLSFSYYFSRFEKEISRRKSYAL